MTEFSRAGTTPSNEYAVDAACLAVDDAGIERSAIDGLLIAHSPIESCDVMGIHLQNQLGLGDLRLLQDIHVEGCSSMAMLQTAALFVSAGLAENVLCVWADAPVVPGQSAGQTYNVSVPHGHMTGWEAAHGLFGAATAYGLCARRHMARYGTTTDHLGAVAVSARTWASGNPRAMLHEPLTLEEHHASPMIADPFRRLDCAFPVNGGVAFVVSSDAAAADSIRPRVRIAGIGQSHRPNYHYASTEVEVDTSAGPAARSAMQMAGVDYDALDLCELYDCFSYAPIVLIEDLGFCPKGEGGDFIRDGNIDLGGVIPTNTGGGQLSGYYLQGMTPISEALIQLRHEGGERQVADAEVALVQGHGGIFNYHACAVLTREVG